jgi:hypothetical protein
MKEHSMDSDIVPWFWKLEFGTWNLFGIWNLLFGFLVFLVTGHALRVTIVRVSLSIIDKTGF